MHVVKASAIVAALEPAAFEDLAGQTHQGGIVSHLQYRQILEQLGKLGPDVPSQEIEASIREILNLLGFDAAGIAAGLALPTKAFFAVVDDFFEKYRGEARVVAVEQPPVSPPAAS
jgi:hypothetical protein